MKLDKIIRRYVLINSTKHEGQAQPKSVLGSILSDEPDLRKRLMELRSLIEEEIEEINKWTLEKQKKELQKLGNFKKQVKKVMKKDFLELDLEREGFVVRFAPNPDGALHMGNARPAVICSEYAKKYNGKLILRYDDTDPKIKIPEKKYYKWIKEDLKWLGIKYDKVIIASKRINIYYKYAEELLKMNKAYVCTCEIKKWRVLKNKKKACPCRIIDYKTNLIRWKKMKTHNYKEGQAVLRIKTDIDAKNPAIRDWAAFRIIDEPKHPLIKKKFLWPLYNFASAIDDKLTNVTHIFRGQEHSTNEVKQRYVYDYFGWKYPFSVILGRFSMSNMILSKSKIREGIREGNFNSWDDLRLGTLRALKRRGFKPETIKDMIYEIGPKPSDITISFENLASYNRKKIDKISNRYFFIHNPKKIIIKNFKIKKHKIPLHPDNEKGYRNFSLTNIFYINEDDFNKYQGVEIRLKNLCNIKLSENPEYSGTKIKNTPKIHWVPEKHIQVRILMPDKEIKGYGEKDLTKVKVGTTVQLERFGFVKIEKSNKNNVLAVFCHE